MNTTTFFAADEPVNGYELWKSDGSTAGTVLVKDINRGPRDSVPRRLTNVNGTLFFTGDEGSGSRDLWKSDGTATGTAPVHTPSSANVDTISVANLNGSLFFIVNGDGACVEIWRSSATVATTVQIAAIPTAGLGLSAGSSLMNVNGTLFFFLQDGELWKSDGTAAGTVLVRKVHLGPAVGGSVVEVDGTLSFSGSASGTGYGLWKSDGSTAGTVLVKDINPGPGGSLFDLFDTSFLEANTVFAGGPLVVNADGRVVFRACEPLGGCEPWESDGTEAGTRRP